MTGLRISSGFIKSSARSFLLIPIQVGVLAGGIACWGNWTLADEVKAPPADQADKVKQTAPTEKQKEALEKSGPKIDNDRLKRKTRWVMDFSVLDGRTTPSN
jgi:hypothetical protein